jgi:hypothetical protein
MRCTTRLSVMVALMVIACASIPARAATMSVHRALNFTVEIAKFDNVPLDTVIQTIQEQTQANFHVNWKALEAVGVGKDAQINLNLRHVSVQKLLDLALDQAGAGTELATYVDQGVIEITTREIADSKMITRIYPIDDLLIVAPDFTDAPDFNITSSNTQTSGSGGGGGSSQSLFSGSSTNGSGSQPQQMTKAQRAQELIDKIMQLIQPEIWQPNGGKATIEYFDGSLIVHAPRSAQEALGGPID